MILTPAPLQRPSVNASALPSLRATAGARLALPGATPRPVLQTLHAPQQLCLDLQPRSR